MRGGIAALSQLDKSLDEASTTLGANGATTFKRVLMPLLKPAVIGALIYGFVRSMTTVSAIVFPGLGRHRSGDHLHIIGRVVNGDYGVAIAYCAVLILIMVTAIMLVQWVVGSRKLGAARQRIPARQSRPSRWADSAPAPIRTCRIPE